MKIRVWAAVLLLFSGAAVGAWDGMDAVGEAEATSCLVGELALATPPAPILSPSGLGMACGPADWQQYRHGDLWSDYCYSKSCRDAAGASTDGWLQVSPPHPTRGPWAWRGPDRWPCRTCRPPRRPVLDLLRSLLGWNRRTVYHVGYYDDSVPVAPDSTDDPVPVAPDSLDDLLPVVPDSLDDPAPQPPVPEPADDLGDARAVPHIEPDRAPDDAEPPAPTPDERSDPDIPPSPSELPPAPADDPVPVPQLEIPRNTLPKPQQAAPPTPDTARGTGGRTVLAGRLSDYIRTR